MRYIIWTARLILFVIVAGFLHYTLPQRDIVRIVNTYEERHDFGGFSDIFWQNTGAATADQPITRDVLYIQTVLPDGDPMVYRNQDTGWGWPPYFKFDTANLQTEAADAISPRATPEWYAIRHYGWRITWLGDGVFPNALSMKPVAGPASALATDDDPYLWLDPVIDEIDETADEARGAVSRFFGRFRK